MGGPRRWTVVRAIVAAGLLSSAAACSGGDDDEPEPTTTSESTTTTEPVDTSTFAAFDWTAPQPTVVGPGWTLQDCPGDDHVLCLVHEDGRDAKVSYFLLPAPPDNDLAQHAERFITEFRDDRERGCGHGYLLEPDPPTPLELADGPAYRYGFTGGSGGSSGRVSEHTVQWAGIRNGQLVLVTISGYDPGACVTPEGSGTLQDIDEVLTGVGALVVAAGLPRIT